MEPQNKNVRISKESYQMLKDIKYFTDKSFVEISNEAIKDYYDKLVSKGIINK